MSIEKTDKILKINSRLEVRREGEDENFYKSMILGVKGKAILINPPYRGKDDLLLYQGDKADIVVLSDKEKYLFQGTVLQRVTKPFRGYVVEAGDEARRIQMRSFVRIKVLLETEWVKLPEKVIDKKQLEAMDFKRVLMTDLSGGGANVILDEMLTEGTKIMIRFCLETDNEKFDFMIPGEVRRSAKLDDRKEYATGISFFGISEKERDQIVKYVFYRQRIERLLSEE